MCEGLSWDLAWSCVGGLSMWRLGSQRIWTWAASRVPGEGSGLYPWGELSGHIWDRFTYYFISSLMVNQKTRHRNNNKITTCFPSLELFWFSMIIYRTVSYQLQITTCMLSFIVNHTFDVFFFCSWVYNTFPRIIRDSLCKAKYFIYSVRLVPVLIHPSLECEVLMWTGIFPSSMCASLSAASYGHESYHSIFLLQSPASHLGHPLSFSSWS